jgi:glutaminyl-peptide cyclotransferase
LRPVARRTAPSRSQSKHKAARKPRAHTRDKGAGRWGWPAGGGALVLALAAAVAVALSVRAPAATAIHEALRVEVVATHPHARDAFTQGLLYHDGWLYESTGLVGRSSLRRVELATGRVVKRAEVPGNLFAEGLARVDDRLLQITWHAGKALVWDRDTFEHLSTHRYEGEGWGLCFDGTHLIMSDGSDRLYFRNPRTFDVERHVQVTKVDRPVRHLNELECVGDAVYANVWQREEILRIDAASGKVTATIDASGLLAADEMRDVDVLNGIAYVPERETFLLTGKLWPKLFEVRFVPRS